MFAHFFLLKIVGGVLEIVTGIGDFLPDPVGAIMQPIAGIFNMIFGIGEEQTAEDVIREVCH